jgi:hypothetical protein
LREDDMLSEEAIRDEGWRDALMERHGWMFGGWGYLEVKGGWRHVIADMLQRIESTLVTEEERQGFYVSTIKEKWGTMSVSVHNGDDRIDAIVDAAERASGMTCDVCGGWGRRGGKGWIVTRCSRHMPQEHGA